MSYQATEQYDMYNYANGGGAGSNRGPQQSSQQQSTITQTDNYGYGTGSGAPSNTTPTATNTLPGKNTGAGNTTNVSQSPQSGGAGNPQQVSTDQGAVTNDMNTQTSTVQSPPQQSQPSFQKGLWMYGTRYEVKDDETFAYFDGYVVDYKPAPPSGRFVVHFKDDWKQPIEVEPYYIRPVPPPLDHANWNPSQGDRAECQAKAETHEPFGWWSCVIQRVNVDYFLINFEGWGDDRNEVLSKRMLRPYNTLPPLDRNVRYMKDEHELPDDLIDWVKESPQELQHVATRSGLVHLGLKPGTDNVLVLIGTMRAMGIAKLCLPFLTNLQKKYQTEDENLKDIEAVYQADINKYQNAVRLDVKFDPFLTRYVIGRGAQNLKDIKALHKDIDIKVEDGKCSIMAPTDELAQQVRDRVEIVMEKVKIPTSTVRDVIGPGGENVRKLEKDTHVLRIETYERFFKRFENDPKNPIEWDPSMEANDETTWMVIIGSRASMKMCVGAILMEAEHRHELRAKQRERQEIESQLTEMGVDHPNSRSRQDRDARGGGRDGDYNGGGYYGDNNYQDDYPTVGDSGGRRRRRKYDNYNNQDNTGGNDDPTSYEDKHDGGDDYPALQGGGGGGGGDGGDQEPRERPRRDRRDRMGRERGDKRPRQPVYRPKSQGTDTRNNENDPALMNGDGV